MSGLIKVGANEFAALSPDSMAAIALRENIGNEGFSESDLIRVKTPSGGALFWTIEGPSGPETAGEIEGVLVFQGLFGLLWPSLEPSDDSKPVLETKDLRHAKIRGAIKRDESGKIVSIEGVTDPEMLKVLAEREKDGVVNWAELPYCEFGTGKNGSGKFAKEGRALFILRKGSVLPLLIRTGPSALGIFKKFLTQLEVPYWMAVVGLTLKEEKSAGGQKYSLIVPKLKGVLEPEAAAQVKTQYHEKLKAGWEAGNISASTEAADQE